MVKRRRNRNAVSVSNTKGQIHKSSRPSQTRQPAPPPAPVSYAAPPEQPEDEYDNLPAISQPEQNALATTDLNPLQEAIIEMRSRIQQAEQNVEHSRQSRELLQQKMDNATQLAAQADDELKSAAQKAAQCKYVADHVLAEGLPLKQQLDEEEQRWQRQLEEDRQLLDKAEQTLAIAEEETRRISHAKEVAARMNERDLWRLGSSKQGLWLQRRQLQGNAVPMTRGKDGGWQMSRPTSPGATYAQTMLEREQKHAQKLREDHDPEQKTRLRALAESAQSLAQSPSSQLEDSFLEQLAAREAARHLAAQAAAATAEPATVTPPPMPAEPAPITGAAPPAPAAPVVVTPPLAPMEPLAITAPPIPAEPAPITVTAPPIPAEPVAVTATLAPIEPTAVTPPPTPAAPLSPLPPLAPLNTELLQAMHKQEQPPVKEAPKPTVSTSQPVDDDAFAASWRMPEGADPLQFLAMRAAAAAAANQTAVPAASPAPPPYIVSPLPPLTAPETKKINEEDMQHLTQQANILAQQHLNQRQEEQPAPPVSIAQKVAEETGAQHHLLKEQQAAERAIAAAMAAAKKAAQSAMAISEQAHQQAPRASTGSLVDEDRPYSVERIIADALSKAAVVDQYKR